MLDLVILLSMALALTTVLALLLAGFVWTPWLIGLLLIGLLIALSRVSEPVEPMGLSLESLPDPKQAAPSHADGAETQVSPMVQAASPSPTAEHPVLTYRGAHPAPHLEGPSPPTVQPVLTYRGAKSQSHEVIPQALLAKWQGKYRGNPLKRPEGSEPS